jgi:predicted neutral ceramidase superfamily lipid hydrolase
VYIRAIVLDNGTTRAALINVDVNASAGIPAKVAAELKCPRENVISSSTHSHSVNLGGPQAGTPGPESV